MRDDKVESRREKEIRKFIKTILAIPLNELHDMVDSNEIVLCCLVGIMNENKKRSKAI